MQRTNAFLQDWRHWALSPCLVTLQLSRPGAQVRSGDSEQQQVLTPGYPWSVTHHHGHQTVTSEHPQPRTLLPCHKHLWGAEVEKMELKVWTAFIAKFFIISAPTWWIHRVLTFRTGDMINTWLSLVKQLCLHISQIMSTDKVEIRGRTG